jgi:hypothetical protein
MKKEDSLNPQIILTNVIQSRETEEMKISPQLTVGELIFKLEAIDKDLPIYFDNEKYRPTSIGSWRGSYDELSINYKGEDNINSDEIEEVYIIFNEHYIFYKPIDTTLPKNVKVKDLLQMLKMAVGKTMEGYEGGNFLIKKTTPVWVSAYGESEGYKTNKNYDPQAIIDVRVKNKKAILITKLMPY